MTVHSSLEVDWTTLAEECLQVLAAEETSLRETRAHLHALSTSGVRNFEGLSAVLIQQDELERASRTQREARWSLQQRVAERLDVAPHEVRLSRILPHLPPPVREQVADRLRHVRRLAEETGRQLRRSRGQLLDLHMLLSDVLSTAVEGPAASARYSASGGRSGSPHVPLLKVRS